MTILKKAKAGLARFLRLIPKNPRAACQIASGLVVLVIQRFCLRRPILYVRRHGGMGDIVCTFPSVAALKTRHPGSFLVYATHPIYIPLVRCFRDVDLVIDQDSLLANLMRSFFKPRIAVRPFLPDEKTPPLPRERIHLVDEFHRSFGLEDSHECAVRLDVPAGAVRQVERRLRHEGKGVKTLIVIHTGPTWEVKEWPQKSWCELVARLTTQGRVLVIQIGEDRTAYGKSRESIRVAGAMNWIGKLTIGQTLALLSLADLFVGIDSGVLHLAGAVNTPCVGIFGPTDPACFLPRNARARGVLSDVSCLGCHHEKEGPRHWRVGCANNIQCMSDLPVARVYEACNDLLSEG